MKPKRILILATLLAAAATGLDKGHQALERQRSQLNVSAQHVARLNRELATLNQHAEATLRELAGAKSQSAALSGLPLPATNNDSHEGATDHARWIARVTQLKQLVAAHPEQTIPEMRLLTDDDWLLVTRKANLESAEGTREALAALRTAAKDRCAVDLADAIRKFNAAAPAIETVVAAPGRAGEPGTGRTKMVAIPQPPATALALLPYLSNPADADVLRRLDVVIKDSGWLLRETNPIDVEYDAGYRLFSNGGNGTIPRAPWAWFPLDIDERSIKANQAYRDFNGGISPSGIADTFPYFDPPLETGIMEKILRAERRGSN